MSADPERMRAGDLDRLVERARRAPGRVVVLVDGGSGAGKTTLAGELAPRLGAQFVSLDDLSPGWQGLAAGAAAVAGTVLRDRDPGWRRWDWHAQADAEWHPVDPVRPIVIEGCGALNRAARQRASLGVWIELDAAERRRRALARDGDVFAPHWDEWARQEAAFREIEPPTELADVVWTP